MRGALFVVATFVTAGCASAQQRWLGSDERLAATGKVTEFALPHPMSGATTIALAPDGNTRLALAREAYEQANAREKQARGYLLPNVEGSYTLSSFTRNLAAFGVQSMTPIPGFGVPSFVGPITNSDIRATATQTVFDLSAIIRYHGARTNVSASKHDVDAARNQASAAVAKAGGVSGL